jgi:hypothetical protein
VYGRLTGMVNTGLITKKKGEYRRRTFVLVVITFINLGFMVSASSDGVQHDSI